MKKNMRLEVLAPVSSFATLDAAIQAKADAIYCGVGSLNMRARNGALSLSDLVKITQKAHAHTIKVYLALNIVCYDTDMTQSKKLLVCAKKAEVDAIICTDIAIIQLARELGLRVHISTQANVSNSTAVKFYSQYADTIVLARELSLQAIKKIRKYILAHNVCGPSGKLIELEAFCHGALCVAVSGKCYMSLAQYNTSANRGACLQACRRKYTVQDTESQQALEIDNKYIMSPKDLCTIGMIDKLVAAGISLFKIEGRARSADYVYTTTKIYKEALERVASKTYTQEWITQAKEQLLKVYNRGFWDNGYYLGIPTQQWANGSDNKATTRRVLIGTVQNYYPKVGVASITCINDTIRVPCKITIEGKTTGFVEQENTAFMQETQVLDKLLKGLITCKFGKVRKGDNVFATVASR